eukprot:TRINITY_DN5913_c0_g5_i1.p1 TRINITY_DN5913_c0_g5~~TRINITY_DN5913_c0_g5_i1.p1  ORF type:complete len:542 (+),score=121.76 TRINITY_DN5913_c0_g5_i1:117-1742(+)
MRASLAPLRLRPAERRPQRPLLLAALLLLLQASIVGSADGEAAPRSEAEVGSPQASRLLLPLLQTSARDPQRRRTLQETASRELASVQAADGSRGGGSHPVSLTNLDDVQYLVEITVGSPCEGSSPQRFHVVPDTGSADVWVTAENCSQCFFARARFDERRSCTARSFGKRVTFKYGDGTHAVGTSLEDTVQVGELKVERQFLIQVDDMESTTRMRSDGILGLAHRYDTDVRAPDGGLSSDAGRGRTFLHTLFEEHPQLERRFSFFLTGHRQEPSQLVLGDPDLPSFAKEKEFRYGKSYYMSETSLWLTSVWSIGWSESDTEISFSESGSLGAPALVDSGSSLIVLDPDLYDQMMGGLKRHLVGCEEIPANGVLRCACPAEHELGAIPSLVFNVIDGDDKQFSLCMAPHEYLMRSSDAFNPGSYWCMPALQRGSKKQPVPLILGMTFLRAFYTTFDVERHRIGFARSKLSPLAAEAKCYTASRPVVKRVIWFVSLLLAVLSLAFACYVFWLPRGFCPGARRVGVEEPGGSHRELLREQSAA